MNSFDYTTTLQYRVKSLEQQVAGFESGERYIKLENKYNAIIRSLEKTIRKLKYELSKAHSETVNVRKIWFETMDGIDKEHQKELARKDSIIKKLIKENEKVVGQKDKLKKEKRKKQLKIYELGTQLEEERELNKKLTAQVNKDFENSSIPSSLQKPGRKKIPNSRVKTGRKQGGQPGHKGHCRKKHIVTETHEIPAPKKYTDNLDYYETGKIIRKQNVIIRMSVNVTEYTTREYRNRKTGGRVHAKFPEGYINEVNYDGIVKALAFLLSNECCVSHGKTRKLISELTDGEIELSDGMINGLCEEFSVKTVSEKHEIIKKLMTSPVINADFTNASVNGKSAQVLVLASPSADVALYIGKEKKGHEGIKGSPLENYVGTVVHDHDKTFYHYGTRHQECTQHDCRYLTGSEQNEPELKWNKSMHKLLREMVHYKNVLDENTMPDINIVKKFEKRYDKILDKAEEEYNNNPPSKYYREGYNLFVRLRKYKESELLFLHDSKVPANNSLCERLARVFKRKQKQAVTLRSQSNLEYICDGLSIVYLLRKKYGNVYHAISDIYDRKRPPKPKTKEADTVV